VDIIQIDSRYKKRNHLNPDYGKPLTETEIEILKLVANGETTKSIAFIRSISTKTAEKHRERMMRKLDLHCIADLTHFALATGVCGNKFGGNHHA
jgi:DNA-binding NarL/FixJ family response regulator